MARKLYGVFLPDAWGLTYNKRQALTLARRHSDLLADYREVK